MSVTLVTGSVRGLGLACARELAARGDRVHVVYRSSGARAEGLAGEFEGRIHRADLEDDAAVAELIRRVLEVDGALDHVVHAVGEYAPAPPSETSVETLRWMMRSNVETTLRLFGAVREPLRAARGAFVAFGFAGLDGYRARRQAPAYGAAKAALLTLVRSWAVEEAPHGVRVNMVSPGMVPHDAAHPDTTAPETLASIPAGRPGRPEDIARAVAHLCSPASEYTTGANLTVAGGWLL